MYNIVVALLLILVIWYWWDTVGAKEVARRAGLKACNNADVQFLDDTVAKQKIWLKRNERGHLTLCRYYTFEFTHLGDQRYQGHIRLQGKRVNDIQMETYNI